MDIVGNTGPQVLNQQATEQRGEIARISSFIGAIAVGDLVKTTLGPKGMDKILKPMVAGPAANHITITNDGATILRSMHVDNPAAKILIDISKTQDEEVGDGTTTVAVLAAELLREAEKLMMQKIHPQKIISGWRKAREVALATLMDISRDNAQDKAKFEEDLLNIARTTLSSKLLTQDKEHYAKLAVDAVLKLKGSGNLDYIKVIQKCGGSIRDSFLSEGFILEKQITVGCPKTMENCKIMVANTPMDYDKIKIYGTKVKVDSMDSVAQIEQAEKEKMQNKVDRILKYGPNVFINRQLIYNYPEQLFADKGILVIEHADFDGIERLAKSTGAEILSTFNNPERSEEVLGHADSISEMMLGEDKVIVFKGCKSNEACTIVLRGASSHILAEAERSLHDALCVLVSTIKNTKVVYGGGHSEIAMANACEKFAKTLKGKEALAVECYSKALRQLPTIIADNGGYDSAELVQILRAEVEAGNKTAGLNMNLGCIGDMKALGVTECMRVKEAEIFAATEAAEMILRVDDIIKCAPRQRQEKTCG